MRQMGAIVALVASFAAGSAPNVGRAEDSAEGLRDALAQSHDAAADADAADFTEADFLGEEELDTLVAPVALYPDALLAQVLVAATYPLQVVEADRLLKASSGLSETELSDRLSEQDWDPSVLVLVSGFPTVIERMSDDLDWTEELGDAMVRQDDDVLQAVQRMRVQAKETGYLTSNAAQVVEEDQGEIAIKPANPDVIYVPTYDATRVYTTTPTAQPYIAPARSTGLQPNPLVTGAIVFGAALLVQQLFGDDDHDKKDDSWHDYWHRSRPIDWRDRQFYPRPFWQDDDYHRQAWSHERDRYWDPRSQRWRRDGREARNDYEVGRRDTLGWLVVDDPRNGQPRVRAFRGNDPWTSADEQARHQAERAAEARRAQRAEAERRADKQLREAEERREDAIAAQRRAARERAEQQEKALKQQNKIDEREAKAKAEAREAAARDRAKAATAAKPKPVTASQAKLDAAFEQQRVRDAQKAAADARAKAAVDARAKASTDARAKAAADARAKAAADTKVKSAADAKARQAAAVKARQEADAKANAAASARMKAAADAKAKAAADAKAKAAANAKAKAAADAKAKAVANAKAKAAADAKARAVAEARAKAAAQAQAQKAAAQQQQVQQQRQKAQPQKAQAKSGSQQQQQQTSQKNGNRKKCQSKDDKDCKR